MNKNLTRKEFITQSSTLTGGLLLSTILGTTFRSCIGGQENGPIIVGHQADLTGGISSWGYWIHKAAVAAVDEINKVGGINDRQLKLVVEDTETNPTVGQRKFRKLVNDHRADFVIGSVHSGVMMATVPLAKELKTLYMPIAMACEATSEKGNRYIYRMESEVCTQAQASTEWMVKQLAKKWTIVVADYSWGWSHEEMFSHDIAKKGGEVLAKIRVPVGTKDFSPHLSKIPKDTEGIYFIFFGADSTGFIQQLYEHGYRKQKFTMICTLEAIDVASLGAAVEGMYLVEYFPRQLQYADNAFNKKLRSLVNVDNEGYEIGNRQRVLAGSHYWASFQHINLVAEIMKKIEYKNKKEDTNRLIEALEDTTSIKQSYAYPQGDMILRPQDHQGFHKHWMSKVVNGKLEVQFAIEPSQVLYNTTVDFTKETF